jgi:hypothetical protein
LKVTGAEAALEVVAGAELWAGVLGALLDAGRVVTPNPLVVLAGVVGVVVLAPDPDEAERVELAEVEDGVVVEDCSPTENDPLVP